MITKDNVLTYALKGFMALIYTIFRRPDKIRGLFYEEDVFQDVKLQTTRLQEASDAADAIDKLTFKYKYKKKNGRVAVGTFDAYNKEQAQSYLKGEGYDVVSIEPVQKNIFNSDLIITSPIKLGELSFSLTQVSTYLKAGIPLIDAYRILAKQAKKNITKKIYDTIVYDLLSGESLSEALARQPKVFPKLLTNMIKSAELTGDYQLS